MAYLGNTPSQQAFAPAVDYFNGTGSATAFTLSRPVASVAQVQVTIENVPQNPSSSFTVSGSTITFTSAPPSGTSNIYVQYTSPITQVVALPQDPQVFGNLQFSSVGARITGDFSNGTASNRVILQTSTVNANTLLEVMTNGTATTSAVNLANTNDNANCGLAQLQMTSTSLNLNANLRGTGTYLPMTFQTGGSERIRIDTSGNVGIGTASPATKLDVNGNIVSGSLTCRAVGGEGGQVTLNNTTDTAGAYNFDVDGSNHGRVFTTQNNTNLSLGQLAGTGGIIALYTAATERMRIDSSGNVLVNSATSPSGSGNAFFNGIVYVGSTNTDPTFNRVSGLNISATGTINARANTTWDLGRDVTSGSHINFYTDNGSARVAAGSISSNGGTTSYNTTSDYRMKENIAPMAGALTIIQALKPITYDWKEEFVGTKKSSQGFIAHELAEVVPDCVTGEKDAVDDEGKPKYQGIDTSFLVATLTAAIQEQQALIIQLQADVAALKGIK